MKLALAICSLVCALVAYAGQARAQSSVDLKPLPVPQWATSPDCKFLTWGGYTRAMYNNYTVSPDGDGLNFEGQVSDLITCVRRQGKFVTANLEGKHMKLYAVKVRPGLSSVAYASARFSGGTSPHISLRMPLAKIFSADEMKRLQNGETLKKSIYLVQQKDNDTFFGSNVILFGKLLWTYRLDFEYDAISQNVSSLNLSQLN